MKIVQRSEFDSLVQRHSASVGVREEAAGTVTLTFGPANIPLAEDSARDFLYELTRYFAQKDLLEYEGVSDPDLRGSRDALAALLPFRGSSR